MGDHVKRSDGLVVLWPSVEFTCSHFHSTPDVINASRPQGVHSYFSQQQPLSSDKQKRSLPFVFVRSAIYLAKFRPPFCADARHACYTRNLSQFLD